MTYLEFKTVFGNKDDNGNPLPLTFEQFEFEKEGKKTTGALGSIINGIKIYLIKSQENLPNWDHLPCNCIDGKWFIGTMKGGNRVSVQKCVR